MKLLILTRADRSRPQGTCGNIRNYLTSLSLVGLCGWSLGPGCQATAAEASPDSVRVIEVRKIWDAAPHNAFTDLIRFRERWFCCFREAEAHVGGDGRVRLLTSTNGLAWMSAAVVTEQGIDLRDPKLSITPEGRLMLVAGGSVYRGGTRLLGRQPRVAFSEDGRHWTRPKRILGEGDWLWRVTWHKGMAYGVSYNTTAQLDPNTSSVAQDWTLTLYRSRDGLSWEPVASLAVPGRANETTLRFTKDDRMIALVRREGANQHGWIGVSRPPYTQWKWQETSHRLGGPNFVILPDGSMWAGSRLYPGGPKTVIARMTETSYEPVLTLPSGGDTSYPGLVWHDGLLWVSYYSSHEGKAAIYLARIRLPARD